MLFDFFPLSFRSYISGYGLNLHLLIGHITPLLSPLCIHTIDTHYYCIDFKMIRRRDRTLLYVSACYLSPKRGRSSCSIHGISQPRRMMQITVRGKEQRLVTRRLSPIARIHNHSARFGCGGNEDCGVGIR